MYKAVLPPFPWATQEIVRCWKNFIPDAFWRKIKNKKKLIKQHRTLEIVVFGVEDVPGGQLELLCWKLWDTLRLFVCLECCKASAGAHRCFGAGPSSSHPQASDARGSPHTPSPSPPTPARSPRALRSLPPPLQVPEAGGSQLHLCKLDGILVALPVEPVDAL